MRGLLENKHFEFILHILLLLLLMYLPLMDILPYVCNLCSKTHTHTNKYKTWNYHLIWTRIWRTAQQLNCGKIYLRWSRLLLLLFLLWLLLLCSFLSLSHSLSFQMNSLANCEFVGTLNNKNAKRLKHVACKSNL